MPTGAAPAGAPDDPGALADAPGSSDADLPEAAGRRLGAGAWSSGLSVADFASCLDMGLEPVGYVQGYAVMQWNWYMATGGLASGLGGVGRFGGGWAGGPQRAGQYVEEWRCPHGFISAEHRVFGANYELTWLEDAWATGWGLAVHRMVEEATALGATGVVGVRDEMVQLTGASTAEFRASGTAVVVRDAPRPPEPFTTYLSGQRLGKLIEAGFSPVAVVATMSSVRMLGYCVTLYQLGGSALNAGWVSGVGPIEQVNHAQSAARALARERVRAQLGSDRLHGASLVHSEREIGEGDLSIHCTLKGNRVRRFKEFDPLQDPSPVVPLS